MRYLIAQHVETEPEVQRDDLGARPFQVDSLEGLSKVRVRVLIGFPGEPFVKVVEGVDGEDGEAPGGGEQPDEGRLDQQRRVLEVLVSVDFLRYECGEKVIPESGHRSRSESREEALVKSNEPSSFIKLNNCLSGGLPRPHPLLPQVYVPQQSHCLARHPEASRSAVEQCELQNWKSVFLLRLHSINVIISNSGFGESHGNSQ